MTTTSCACLQRIPLCDAQVVEPRAAGDSVYEIEGDTLTIWGGEKGSPAYYKGTFSKDGDTLTRGWVYPSGGYKTTSTRVK